jgi:hypothetical protein
VPVCQHMHRKQASSGASFHSCKSRSSDSGLSKVRAVSRCLTMVAVCIAETLPGLDSQVRAIFSTLSPLDSLLEPLHLLRLCVRQLLRHVAAVLYLRAGVASW